MTTDAPELKTLAMLLEMIVDRLDKLEVQVRGLVRSQTVEAKEFVVKEDPTRLTSSTVPLSWIETAPL